MRDPVEEILTTARTVAMVGLSPDPQRWSYRVAEYLRRHGYRVIPVNPTVACVLGERAYPTLRAIPQPVDVVTIFRSLEHVPGVVDAAVAIGARAIWMPEGVRHERAAARAEAAGILVVMDRCMKQEHERLLRADLVPEEDGARVHRPQVRP
ncbi:MAG TPA: CoA-binding protein [bacterium]|nr:CoA-binding protein [bacterium]